METIMLSVKDFPAGKLNGIEKGGKSILITNIKGKYYAIGNSCAHRGCTLSDGTLNGETVQCPCHGSVFNLKTGEVVKGPAQKPVPSYTLNVDGDKLLLSV
jgi:nitrite reductase/ring-hydroxylating ferredoxin subunit